MKGFGRVERGGALNALFSMLLALVILGLFVVQLGEGALKGTGTAGGRVRKVDMGALLDRIHSGSLSRHKARFFHVVPPEGE